MRDINYSWPMARSIQIWQYKYVTKTLTISTPLHLSAISPSWMGDLIRPSGHFFFKCMLSMLRYYRFNQNMFMVTPARPNQDFRIWLRPSFLGIWYWFTQKLIGRTERSAKTQYLIVKAINHGTRKLKNVTTMEPIPVTLFHFLSSHCILWQLEDINCKSSTWKIFL